MVIMKKTKFTETQIVKAIQDHESGRKTEDICRELGITTAAFYQNKIKQKSTARLGLDIHGTVTYFCFSTEKETFEWPN
jgi:predicted transcriptional regulator